MLIFNVVLRLLVALPVAGELTVTVGVKATIWNTLQCEDMFSVLLLPVA